MARRSRSRNQLRCSWGSPAILLALCLILVGCGKSGQSSGSSDGQKIGGTVNVLATWGGDEQASFQAMVKPFEERSGVTVRYEGTRDLNAVLTTRVQGGNPPDVAGLPGPGQMAELARGNKLVDLGPILDASALQSEYSQDWLKLGQVDGRSVGIFIKTALKGAIWNNPKTFKAAGYTEPKTWDEMFGLSQKIVQSGTTPWCIGLESGAASGWPGTDWIESIVLRQAGPEAYDRWSQGTLTWSSPEIRKAWQTWGQIVADPTMVYGGRQGMLATAFGEAGAPILASPPRCYLQNQGSFYTTFFTGANPNAKPGEDFDFFMFPPFDASKPASVEVAGDLFGMFKDTPQSRALMQYLVTPQAQEIWVRRGGAISPNKLVPASAYPDPISAKAAQLMTAAGAVRFDASDLMPDAVNSAFNKAVLDFVNEPGRLPSILTDLDRVQAETAKH